MKVLFCEFNMDTGCVEIVFDENLSLSINCTAVEHLYGDTIADRSQMDDLIYNHPLEYAELVLSGQMEHYLSL